MADYLKAIGRLSSFLEGDASPADVTTMPSEWLIGSLWVQGAARCHVSLPDTCLCEFGEPSSWLFASRNGEILRKRNVKAEAFLKRLRDLATRAMVDPEMESQKICTAWFKDGRQVRPSCAAAAHPFHARAWRERAAAAPPFPVPR